MRFIRPRRILASVAATAFAAGLLALLGGCASDQPDLTAMDRKIEVERFMGDWYVLAFIPIDLPFFSEAGAHGAVESYQLKDEGKIDVTYTFRDGSFEAEPTVMTQRGRVIDDGRGTEWRVQIFWPFESAYLIAWLDADYERAIVGVPSRSNVWILSRDPLIDEVEFAALTSRVADLGYDPTMLRRVPQRAESR
jgi:apolipoprotein D and lipocalin family protein